MSEVVTVLKVSAQQSIDELKKFEEAMNRAAGVNAKFVTEITESPRSISSISKSLERLQSAGDPVFAAQVKRQNEVQKAFQAAGLAVSNGLTTQEKAAVAVKNLADRYDAQVIAAQKAAFAQTTLGKATTGVSGQLVAMSAGAGPVGVFLASLGPWGLAAAAGLTLVEMGLNAAHEAAHKLGDEANSLNKFAEATGLTTDQIQALTAETAKNGISAEATASSIIKFTTAWDQLRQGQGDFLTKIRAIDSSLADQLQRTTDVTQALNIYAAAVKKAEEQNDIAARNALLRAAGGKGGVVNFGTITGSINNAGGVDGLTQSFAAAHATLGSGLLQDLDKLKNEIDENKKRADQLFASIGAKPVLEAEAAWQRMRLQLADTAVALAEAEKSKPFWEWFIEKLAQGGVDGSGIGALGDNVRKFATSLPGAPVGRVTKGADLPDPSAPLTPQAEAARQAALVSALGSSATAVERYRARVAQLDATWKQAGLTEAEYLRARNGTAIDLENQAIGARVSVIGIIVIAKKDSKANERNERNLPAAA